MSTLTQFNSLPLTLQNNGVFSYPLAAIFIDPMAINFLNYNVNIRFIPSSEGLAIISGVIERTSGYSNVIFEAFYNITTGITEAVNIVEGQALATAKLNCSTDGYFCISVKAAEGASDPVIWQFKTFLSDNIVTITSLIGFPLSLIALPPIPGNTPSNPPFVIITNLQLTHCGNIISKVNYEVITTKGVCPNYLCGLIRVNEAFQQNCINIAPLMIGDGCTLLRKIEYLKNKGFNIDYNTLISYSLTRLIFSSILCDEPFNKFCVKFLRQRYYCEFMTKLENSQFKGATVFFTDKKYGFLCYDKYFKC